MAYTKSGNSPTDPLSRFRRATRFLGSHPTRRPELNRFLWTWAVLLAAVMAANTSWLGPTSATATGLHRSTMPAPGRNAVLAPSSTAQTTPSPTQSPSPSSTGPVINGVGAVLPNPTRTPGATNPAVTQNNIESTICAPGWTATIRPPSSYTGMLKTQQLATGYAYNDDSTASDYQEDHLIPLQLGGSAASPLNLWPEPYATANGADTKDRLERKLNSLVCDGIITLAAAQQAIATDWYAAYETYIANPNPASTPVPTAATPA
jgi:hypothetical protein